MYFRGSKNPFSYDSISILIKAAVGTGIALIAIGLILFVNDSLVKMAVSAYLQLAADGLIVIAMSFFTIMVLRRLEYV
jgi:hypothetical protein